MENAQVIEIEKICKYCERASDLHQKDMVLCSKHGVVAADHCCRKFTYDPLKRKVARKKIEPMTDE